MPDVSDPFAELPAMQIRCPHCHHPIEVVDEKLLDELTCPSCGSNITLISRDTTVGHEPNVDDTTVRLAPRRLAHFELLEQLGVGGFGTVWKARDTVLDRIVAVKVPRRSQLTSAESEYFLRDARAAAQLRHPNIVSVHEVGRDGDTLFIASDYVEGANLHEWLQACKLTLREAAELVATIAEAVQHAHERGVIHRDLKPGNILMDSAGQPHVTDFGLAKRETGEITMTVDGQILGTPAYMSPEQARGKAHEADARSDVYALGVILFELLTGELPFRGEKRMLIVQILNDEPPSPRKLNSRVPRDLETICLKCLEKEPNKRYGTMSELSDELRRFLGGEAIQARPVGKLDRGWRWCKRQPLLASSAAAVLVSFAVAVLFACFNAVERSRADAARRESDLDAYSASVLYAHHEIETGSTTRAFDILQKCSVSLRGWEWYFLDRTANWEILRVRNAAFDTTAITISASGHLVATAHASGKVMIWDTRTGQDKSLVTGKLPVWGVAISDDESLLAASLAAANPDGLPTPPDVSRGSDLNVPDSSTSNNAVPLQAIESDSSDIFQGGEVHVYELSTGKLLSKRAHCGREHSLAFMPGRRQLVSPSPDKTVRVWDATTGHDEKVFKGHTSQPISIAVSADGSHIASGTGDHSWIGKRVRFETLIWRLDTNVPVFRLANTGRPLGFLADNRSAITVDSLHRAGLMQYADLSTGTFHVGAVSRSGGLLAFLDSGGGVNITNVVAEQPAPESEMYAHVGTVGTRLIPVSRRPAFTIHDRLLSLSHSGTRLACANSFDAELDLGESLKKLHAAGRLPSGPQLQVVDLSAILPAEINGPIRENVRFNESLASPDDRHVAFIGDMEAIIADARTGATKLDLAQSSTRVGWSNDGNRLAVATSENGTQIWDTNTWKKVVTLPTRPILCLGWRPNNRDIVMMTDAWQVQVWNINTNQLVASYDLDYKADVAEMAWSPSADRLAIATLHGLFVWDFADTTLAQTLDCPISSPIVWSADGKLLAGRGADAKSQNSVMVWETEQWTERFLHTFDDLAPNRLCFSPDAQRLAISVESLAFQEGAVQGLPYSVARGVLLCETESGRELLHIRDGSIKRLPLGVHFSRDGQRLFITGQRDDCFTLQMWDGSPRARVYIER